MEIFKKINVNQNYEISNYGRVRNILTNKILKPRRGGSGNGYFRVQLPIVGEKGKYKDYYIHRLVAQAFLENLDPNATQVNHKDENKANNVVVLNDDGSVNVGESNLEWCTSEYNNNYGTHKQRVMTTKRQLYNHWNGEGSYVEHRNKKAMERYYQNRERINKRRRELYWLNHEESLNKRRKYYL